MSVIKDLFGRSPFGPLVEHTKKVHECVKLVRPLIEAVIAEDHETVHRLQDVISRLEYEADVVKTEVREQLPGRYFLPVDRGELEDFLRCQDRIADSVEDLAVILLIRKTKIHPALQDEFLAFTDQVLNVGNALMGAAEELQNLAATSFGGAEARLVLERVSNLGQEEWKADRLQRQLAQHVYALENELDPVTISFYEKMLRALSDLANNAENTGDLLRVMIVKR